MTDQQTGTVTTTNAGEKYGHGLAGMYQDRISGGYDWTGPNPYGVDRNAMELAQSNFLTGLGRDYAGPGGYMPRAAETAMGISQFKPGQIQSQSILGGDLPAYLRATGYDPEAAERNALDQAKKLGAMAGINEGNMANQLDAGGPSVARSHLRRGAMQGEIASNLAQQLRADDLKARQMALGYMTDDITRDRTDQSQNIGNLMGAQTIKGQGLNNLYAGLGAQRGLFSDMGAVGRNWRGDDIQQGMFEYQDFLRGDPLAALGQYGGFLSAGPWGGTQTSTGTSTKKGQGKSPFEQAVGLTLAGVGAYGSAGGFA